jgi:hypothetical protein
MVKKRKPFQEKTTVGEFVSVVRQTVKMREGGREGVEGNQRKEGKRKGRGRGKMSKRENGGNTRNLGGWRLRIPRQNG